MKLSMKQRGLRATLASFATGAVVASLAAFAPTAATAADASTTDGINGYRSVGYFAQWGVYGRNYKLYQLDQSGGADNLTHINYSFGNIHYKDLTCFIANKAQGTGPNGSDGAGDAWADFGMGYNASNSVAGVTDTWDQPLAGSFNQLKQLKAKHPGLKVMISLGGWTWSKNFSAAAATDASRKKFVSSCIDLYLKGNLPVIDGRGGPAAAAGVFDGIDIDWEWPGSHNGEVGNIVDEVNDKANFKLLLKEFRTQLDAYGKTTGKHYELSAFLPANPVDIAAGGWNDPELFNYLDFGNIQGYDLHGAWDPTLVGHQANLYDDPKDTRAPHRQFSVDKAVKEYLKTGIDPQQLGVGMAMYGRGWQGATSAQPWTAATKAGPGTWEAGNEDYDKLKSLGTEYYDAKVGAAWRYDGNQWWSYDNTQTIEQKAQYIVDRGLGGGMFWELDGDRNAELLKALANKLRTATPGPVTDGTSDGSSDGSSDGTSDSPADGTTDGSSDGTTDGSSDGTSDGTTDGTTGPGECVDAPWVPTSVYTGGITVSHEGAIYRAKWWTQGETPGTSAVWEKIGDCDTASDGTTDGATDGASDGASDGSSDGTTDGSSTSCTDPAWAASAVYTGGALVSHNGQIFKAKWWTQGDEPDAATLWGPWGLVGSCG